MAWGDDAAGSMDPWEAVEAGPELRPILLRKARAVQGRRIFGKGPLLFEGTWTHLREKQQFIRKNEWKEEYL